MTTARAAVVGRVYRATPAGSGGIALALADVPLDVEVVDGELVAHEVIVRSGVVLVVEAADGGLHGTPMAPLTSRDGRLCFDPATGGARTRDNRLARGALNPRVAEATRFGMVNTFFHATRVARHVNRLLVQLGAARLPTLPVVVGAHAGSRLPGFAQRDGDFRAGRMRPFAGGHYRLSTITKGLPEVSQVTPTGEVHLGPGRLRQRFAGEDNYLRSASHNPATIYHEYGHHLCRHTADFRLNAERRPERQRNGKVGVEEGLCDYATAVALGTGQPYGWYRPERGSRRDPDAWRGKSAALDTDAHDAGFAWSTAWWRCRQRLVDRGVIGAGEDHDRIVISTLLALGEVAGPSASRDTRRSRQAKRVASATVIDCYLGALREGSGPGAVGIAQGVLVSVGLLPKPGHSR